MQPKYPILIYTEDSIKRLAPKESAFKSAKKLASSNNWQSFAKSERSLWGSIRGSGKNPYQVQIDTRELAYKCSCPSRQFPCKHSLALLLLYTHEEDKFAMSEEPDYVELWLDKRLARAEKVEKEEKELSEEEKEKRSKGKAKRDESREQMVAEGLVDLQSWLKDLLRLGLLDLPSKPASFFEQKAARMVDAKAPGIAGRLRAFTKLDFAAKDRWQDDAMQLIAELNLLISAFLSKDESIDPKAKSAIKALVGWNYNRKDILANKQTEKLKDQWLVLGSTITEMDELKVHRSWLHGLSTSRSAILIDFETKFSQGSVVQAMDGTILDAELAFYPELSPHRAFINKQKEVLEVLPAHPECQKNWQAQHQSKVNLLQQNPWINDRSFLVANMQVVGEAGEWLLVDEAKHFRRVAEGFPIDKMLTALLHCNNSPVHFAVVDKGDKVYPLGVFKDQEYLCL